MPSNVIEQDTPKSERVSADVVQRALETAREMLEMDMAFVADTRHGFQENVCVAGDAASFGAEAGTAVPLDGTYCQMLLDGRLDGIVRDARSHPLVRDLEVTSTARIGAYIGVPIELSDGTRYGTFCCLSHEAAPALRSRDARFLSVLARLVAQQLENEARVAEERRVELLDGNVHALLAALAARDGYTEGHSQEVVALALAVGRRLGLPPASLEEMHYAALLHDIGKIGVPDAILRKPGRLDDAEWAEMRRHPEIGEQIVAAMPALAHLAPIIRAEHERWDGGGYPDGLRGEDIPLAARVVLACDAYHAMTSDRPYRVALSADAARAEIERNAGTQFCPTAAAAVVAVVSHLAR